MRAKLTAMLAAVVLAVAVVAPAAAETSSLTVEMFGSGGQVFANGEHAFGFNADGMAGPGAVIATMDWGDGTVDTYTNTDENAMFWCDDQNCSGYLPHVYHAQGFYTLTLTVSQPEVVGGLATGTATWDQVVVDLAGGGTVTASGTVWARFGGMYDQDFPGGLATFKFDARRRAGTSTTSASLTVSVPSMRPDYPPGSDATGMTFKGTSPLEVLYVAPGVRGTGEAFLGRIYGTVTNSYGPAGAAYAMIHLRVVDRTHSLVRISVWNSSMGYTYVDTAYADSGPFFSLSLNDVLLSGKISIR